MIRYGIETPQSTPQSIHSLLFIVIQCHILDILLSCTWIFDVKYPLCLRKPVTPNPLLHLVSHTF